jgi:hypothetical protein
MGARNATKRRGQQLRHAPEQQLRAVAQRGCKLAVALMLLEQGFAVIFDEIHYYFPSTGGRMPAIAKDVSVYLFQARVKALATSISVTNCVRCWRFCGSDAEPGLEADPECHEVTDPFLLALHDQLRFVG